jgi:1-deoxy-D-xylulose-5-phosphate reductoisomerase
MKKALYLVCSDRFTVQNTQTPTLEDILTADRWARQAVVAASEEFNKGDRLIFLK